MITYKYKLYQTDKNKHLDKMLREAAFVWNHALAIQKRYYRLYGKYISKFTMQKHFSKRINRNLLHSQTTQEIIERLDMSYNRFFKKIAKRPPKFKKAAHFSSFLFKQGGYKLYGNEFVINKISKKYKFHKSREIEGNIKTIRVCRVKSGQYYLIIVTDATSKPYYKSHNGAAIGIDFGMKTYLTLSDNSTYKSPLFFKQYQSELKTANRRVSRAKKGSNNRKKRLFELNQIHDNITNKRSDYQWKLAHELCRNFDYIMIEDLCMKGMQRRWGKKISDLSHASFVEKLQYVATKYNVVVHKIDRFYPSSKTCGCGEINKSLTLKDRVWTCPTCGCSNERDLLASRNILRRGIYELESIDKTDFSALYACI